MNRTSLVPPLAAALAVLALPLLPTTAGAEEPTTLTGRVVATVGERPGGLPSVTQAIRSADGALQAVTADEPLPDGSRVTATVTDGSDDVVEVESYALRARAPKVTPHAAVHQVYVALVTPAGHPLASNKNTFEAVTGFVNRASDYWESQTGGAVEFAVDPTHLANYSSAYGCDGSPDTVYDMWNEALERFPADGSGTPLPLGPDKHLLLVAPAGLSELDDCEYGYGTIGLHANDTMNAVFVTGFPGQDPQSLYAHELGHNLGLHHSDGLSCPTAQDTRLQVASYGVVAVGNACRYRPYDDLLDVMGYSGPTYGEGSLNVAHVEDLGFDHDALTQLGTGSGTFTIAPLSDSSAPVRGLKVTDAAGVDYFVQYRTASGRDSVALRNPQAPQLGVEVLRENPSVDTADTDQWTSPFSGSVLLDPTPSTTGDYRRALPVGGVFRSADGLVSVRVARAAADGATVVVRSTATKQLSSSTSVSAPKRVRKGARFTVTGTLSDSARTPVPFTDVILQRRYGKKPWATVKTVRTDVRGVASVRTSTRKNASYRWTFSAGSTTRHSVTKAVRLR